MKRILLLFYGMTLSVLVFAQKDWSWWNELHGWEPGMPGWRSFVTISPGYLGPNALPVPDVKKGFVEEKKAIELGSDFHFRTGDNTQNLFAKLYYPFAENKIAIEVYGVFLEHYSMSDEIRDERKARDEDGEGLAVGDLYFSTLIQLFRDKKFPNTLLRMAAKTASGGRLDAARYADSPGYFFDLSFSRTYSNIEKGLSWTPFASIGFYSWQTNDDMNLQNDALMYAVGFDWNKNNWTISNSLSGYVGYKNEKDKPMVYTFDINKQLKNNGIRLQFIQGVNDWEYSTIKLSYIWKWN